MQPNQSKMKVVIQRSLHSCVEVDGKIVGQINKGMVLLVCFEKNDSESSAQKAVEKISKLRIFTDPTTGKMNQDMMDQISIILTNRCPK